MLVPSGWGLLPLTVEEKECPEKDEYIERRVVWGTTQWGWGLTPFLYRSGMVSLQNAP